tara:strand:- start:551 stop:1363 length:813 start_codon:yes stop_codon:yes gene_type:complete
MVKNLLIFTFFVSIGLNAKLFAQGTIMIEPKRIVFNKSELKKIITITNTGDIESVFSVSFEQRSMNENGIFVKITEPEPGQKFADRHLRIYPRRSTLKAGQSQVVVLQRRRNNKMENGEYRSHLTFMSSPAIAPLEIKSKKDTVAFSTRITTEFGMSIPIIIRSGEVSVSASISDIKLKDMLLTFNLNRKGNISLYGDFLIQYIPEQGEPIVIVKAKGFGVYTTIEKRIMKFKLNKIAELNLNKGSIKIIYKARNGVKQEVFAEETLLLN